MVKFMQLGILCRCGEPDVKCMLHMPAPRPKPPKKRKGGKT